jgi:hypothetical protein
MVGLILRDARPIVLPDILKPFVIAHRNIVSHFEKTKLRFTLDGRLVGDIAEATAATAFGLQLCTRRTPGVDGFSSCGKSVQVKASGIGKGPAFTPGEGRADHLIFMMIDFEDCQAFVAYNGPEEPVRNLLPTGFTGTKRAPLPKVLHLDESVNSTDRLVRID